MDRINLILDNFAQSNDNLNMELFGMLVIGILLGMGGQSVRLKEECKAGQEYACKADKKLHELPSKN